MKRTTHKFFKRAACILLVILLLFAAGSMAASAVVFRMLFGQDRSSHATELTYADIDAAAYPRRTLSFTSGAHTLRGYLYEKDDPRGVVIVAGGIFAGADRHLSAIVCFLDHGWQVFAFDGTGIGESEGDGIVGLQQTTRDLLEAIRTLEADEKLVGLPFVLYGHSAGGYAAICALADTDRISAVVSMAGFNSPVETMYYHACKRVGALAGMEYPFLWLQNYFVFGKDADIAASDVLFQTDVPVVLIEGSEDAVVPETLGMGHICEGLEHVQYVKVETPYCNTHSGLWLTERAARAGGENTADDLTREERFALNEADPVFMDYVLSFFDGAVSPA